MLKRQRTQENRESDGRAEPANRLGTGACPQQQAFLCMLLDSGKPSSTDTSASNSFSKAPGSPKVLLTWA